MLPQPRDVWLPPAPPQQTPPPLSPCSAGLGASWVPLIKHLFSALPPRSAPSPASLGHEGTSSFSSPQCLVRGQGIIFCRPWGDYRAGGDTRLVASGAKRSLPGMPGDLGGKTNDLM